MPKRLDRFERDEEFLVGRLAGELLGIPPKVGDEERSFVTHSFSIDEVIGRDVRLSWQLLDKSGRKLEANGCKEGVKPGDYFLIPAPNGDTRYRVEKIKYFHEERPELQLPRCWFYAVLAFCPRPGKGVCGSATRRSG